MNKCGTCKFFSDKLADIRYFAESSGHEVEEVKNNRLHICSLLKHLNEDTYSKMAAMTAPAGTIDDSGYYAAFCVSEDFGCNQWQARDTAEVSDDRQDT